MEIVSTAPALEAYRLSLISEEKSGATIEKYLRDARAFCDFAGGASVTKELVIRYKESIRSVYAVASVNSMLASVNHFLAYFGMGECRVRQLKHQRRVFCDAGRELSRQEYLRLIETAKECGNERLALVLQTICSTGIRVSELACITVEAAQRGRATVTLKGKTREVLLPKKLCRRLLAYVRKRNVTRGAVFQTRSGKALDRSNIWREMKSLCKSAGVDPGKVFPHNLRHLFARCYYELKKDIAKLADILGHSSIETTRIYLISSGAQHERTLDRLDLVA